MISYPPMTHCGVDLGGSWIRLALQDGRRLRRARWRVRPGEPLERALGAQLRRMGSPKVGRLVVGAHRAWLPSEKAALRRRLASLAREVLVLSDLELSHRAGLAGGPGVHVVAGTGSAALAMDRRGRIARAGGLGPLLGDEGSSFWIGRRWLQGMPDELVRRFAKRPDAVRAVAALAKTVLRRARRNRRARGIVEDACAELAAIAARAGSRLKLKPPIPVSWFGGLFRDPFFLRTFLKALGPGWRPHPPRLKPEDAALEL